MRPFLEELLFPKPGNGWAAVLGYRKKLEKGSVQGRRCGHLGRLYLTHPGDEEDL